MIFDILTIFPDLLVSPLQEGIIRRAQMREQVTVNLVNLRDFADGPHSVTDDRPFGGGEGMVMKAEPLAAAVAARKSLQPNGRVVLLSPQGRRYSQEVAAEFAKTPALILVCGRYEGVDERFIGDYVDDEISIGDYILTGGELAAMIVIDSVTRLLPGVLGCSDSAGKDTFSRSLLKHGQYTRPRVWGNREVPEQLLSGNHEIIEEFRFIDSVRRTLSRRPELLKSETFSKQEWRWLNRAQLAADVKKAQQGAT